MTNEELKEFLGGFNLCGERTLSGKLVPLGMCQNMSIDDWPETISVAGNTYKLEAVDKLNNNLEEAVYC